MPTTLIFGASRGLGRAFTHHALNQGHRVVALVRSPEMAMELSALGVEVIEGMRWIRLRCSRHVFWRG